jgi:4-diphosphocytidyl-2-C-methyl-D-erythritol kinase
MSDTQETVLDRAAQRQSVDAPAKINLALHVVGRRPDGYHLLESLTVFTGFGDRLSIEKAEADAFSASGPFADDVPLDEDNLVVAARERLRAAFPLFDCPPVSIRLEKNLPIASGLGGGSSDAAAALVALSKEWEIPATKPELARLCPALGADVPMCLAQEPLIATGVGEKIALVPGFPALSLVLVNPGVPVATPQVFRSLASFENPGLPPLPSPLGFDALIGWLDKTRNDLEPTARKIAPEIGKALDEIAASGALISRMSGSGATCFGIYRNEAEARGAARHISRERPGWFTAATQSGGSDGAH